MIREFFTRKLLERKLKNIPTEQRERLIEAMTKNPDFFKKLNEEIEKEKKAGKEEMKASLDVMRKYRSELQKMMQ